MTNPNDAAYPIVEGDVMTDYGLTKRELFAAMAMQGMMDSYCRQEIDDMDGIRYGHLAVHIADALIEALNTPKETT